MAIFQRLMLPCGWEYELLFVTAFQSMYPTKNGIIDRCPPGNLIAASKTPRFGDPIAKRQKTHLCGHNPLDEMLIVYQITLKHLVHSRFDITRDIIYTTGIRMCSIAENSDLQLSPEILPSWARFGVSIGSKFEKNELLITELHCTFRYE